MHFSVWIPIGILLLFSIAVSRLFQTNIEWALSFSVCFFICFIYLTGMFDRLDLGVYGIIIFGIAGAAYLIYNSIKTKSVSIRVTPGLTLFFAICTFAIILHTKETIVGWDEASHWMLTAKNAFLNDRFGASVYSNAYTSYKQYLPGSALFHYYIMKLSGGFSVAKTRISMCILSAAFLSPALSAFSWQKKSAIKSVFLILLFWSIPFICFRNAYNSATVDCILGLLFGNALLGFALCRGRIRYFAAAINIITLGLIKSSGAFLGVVVSLLYIIESFWKVYETRKRTKTGGGKSLLILIGISVALLTLPLLTKYSWVIYLSRQNVHGLRETATIRDLIAGIFNKAPFSEYGLAAFQNFFKSILFNPNFSDATKFYLSTLVVPYSVHFLIVIGLFILGRRFVKTQEKSLYDLAAVFVFVCNILWVLSSSLLYLGVFPESEVAVLSSVSRYLGTYLVAMYFLIIAFLFARMEATNVKQYIVIVSAVFLLLLPNYKVLYDPSYFVQHRAQPLFAFRETDEDERSKKINARYSKLYKYLVSGQGQSIDVKYRLLFYSSEDLSELRMLFAVAPVKCYSVGSCEEAYNIVSPLPDNEFMLFLDANADLSLFDDFEKVKHEGDLQKNTLYYVVHHSNGDGMIYLEKVVTISEDSN
ncbi:MAG: hypothetical protein LLF75_09720 [Eubacteriales bacterium]|nr:hypothetical protein [Eubacteriales bacterium]